MGSQVTSQKVFIEKELSSYHKHMESINEKISENQAKNEETVKKIVSAIEKIANEQSALAGQYKHIENIKATNATVAKEKEEKIVSVIEKIDNNQTALADQYKHIENIIATNATVAKEKEEKDKKYVVALDTTA